MEPFTIAVNISGRQLHDPTIVETVRQNAVEVENGLPDWTTMSPPGASARAASA